MITLNFFYEIVTHFKVQRPKQLIITFKEAKCKAGVFYQSKNYLKTENDNIPDLFDSYLPLLRHIVDPLLILDTNFNIF